ncbi:ABC transporter permease subunit [bacterium]|nr:ABC transporter permease subunit [bacterium]
MTTATIPSTTPLAGAATTPPASFWNTLGAEWSKVATLRSTYLTLGLGLFLSVATTAVASVAMGATNTAWPEEFDPILFSMVGNVFALIVYSVFGVLAVSREYSSGTIRLTLIATPARHKVLFAKLLLVTLTILAFGMLTTIAMFLVGQALLGAYGFPTTTLAETDAQWVVLGLGATMPFFSIIGLALGVLLRSTAGGITTVLGLLWLPQIFGEFMPAWGQEHIISLFPGSALDSMTLGQMMSAPPYSAPPLAALLAATWLFAIVGAAYVAFQRRDA